jgi:hypothetical protein
MNALAPAPKFSLMNLLSRGLDNIFPGFFPGQKHNHYKDFGFPDKVNFALTYDMYQRNSLAKAAVDKTIRKTWQDPPWLLEMPRDGSEGPLKKETRLEKVIRRHFTKIRFWSKVMEADRRSMVGRYSAVILRVADGKKLHEPLVKVRGGLNALVDVIPVWESQLKVSDYNTDVNSLDYGEPKMYEYDEGQIGGGAFDNGQNRSRKLKIHPSRIVIWSLDGSMECDSALKAGLNDLLSIEKILGASGEGFWKNAKQAPILEMDKEADIQKVARAMGIEPAAIVDVMNDQVADWQRGFDELLMIQGMTARLPKVELPDPEHFFMNALQSFSASFDIPLKVLVGTQTGERAATEDASQWNQTCNFRRKNTVIPNVLSIVARLEACGILKENPEWFVDWTDLTESTMLEKIDRAGKMSLVNKSFGSTVFLPSEIRAAIGYEPVDKAELDKWQPNPALQDRRKSDPSQENEGGSPEDDDEE